MKVVHLNKKIFSDYIYDRILKKSLNNIIADYEQRIKDAENNQLTNTPKVATSHYLQDSADSRFRKFLPIGRTTQESTTGKNLWINEIENGETSNGITVTKNKDGSLIFNGTATDTARFYFVKSETSGKYLEQGTNYTISGVDNTNTKKYAGCIIGNIGNNTTSNTRTFSPSSTREIIKSNSYIEFAQGTVLNNYTLKPMVENGSTATAYEPYTGGPAPNPNYLFPIKNTGDNVNEIASFIQPSYNRYEDILDAEIPNINDLLGQKITISFMSDKVGTIYENGNVFTTSETRNIVVGRNSFTFTFKNEIPVNSDTYSNGKLRLLKNSVTTNTCVFTEVKLEQGPIATPYSPYGCGNVNEKVQNKNLFDKTKATNGYINFNDGSFTVSDQYTSSDYIQIEEGQQYYSNYLTFSSSSFGLAFYNKNKKYIRGSQLINKITVPDNAEYIRFCVRNSNYSSGTYITDINTLYFVKGNSPTSYVPHSEQNISFPLAEGQKFYEGDYLADDGVHHVQEQELLDGTQLLSKFLYNSNLSTENYSCFMYDNNRIAQPQNDTDIFVIADKLKGTGSNQRTADIANCWINHLAAGQLGMHVPKSVTTTSELRTYLANNPITFQYKLAKEAIDPYTEGQQQYYDEHIKPLRTYKNITHISSEDETPANVEIEYVRDINTIDDRITALEAKVDLLEE